MVVVLSVVTMLVVLRNLLCCVSDAAVEIAVVGVLAMAATKAVMLVVNKHDFDRCAGDGSSLLWLVALAMLA